jgi:hypothetical protein
VGGQNVPRIIEMRSGEKGVAKKALFFAADFFHGF